MTRVNKDASIRDLQRFVYDVYEIPNDRQYELSEMLNNIQRFAMRGLKGIRKKDIQKTKSNLIISLGWFLSTLNRLHIDLDDEVWKRFPYHCSYCGASTCICKEKKQQLRVSIKVDDSRRPKTIHECQKMFNVIYPAKTRTTDYAGVHLAEEIGEFSEALINYRAEKKEKDFEQVLLEAADYFSCLIGVFNSIGIDLAEELAEKFSDNCHVCHKAPCTCEYTFVKSYKN